MIALPELQRNHRYIDKRIMPWINLHFPSDSSFNGRVVLGYRRKDTEGIFNLTRSDVTQLASFIPEMHVSRNMDYYITANSVSGVRRVTEDVFGLHNIVVDIDCHEEGARSMELLAAFIWRCGRDLWNIDECPEPNSIVFSGRGVQLWWAIEPASAKIQYWYKRMQAWILDALQGVLDEYPEEFASISLDRSASIRLAGLFRLPLTWNTKTGRKGSLQILHRNRSNLRKMLEAYVPEEYNPNKKDRSQRAQWAVKEEIKEETPQEYVPLASRDAEVLRGGTTAMAARVQQLVRLRAMRNASVGNEMRDRFCFTVYCALLAAHDEKEAWKRLLAFNAGFKEPLEASALKQLMSSATERKYRLKNAWVIAELEITEAEQEAIGIRPAAGDSTGRKKRNHTRDMIRKTVREDRDNKILAMFSEGRSKAEIARTLEIAWNTVARVIAAEEAQRAAVAKAQEAEEAAAEPVAVGADSKILQPNTNSSNMVLNNIVFYGRPSSGGMNVSSSEGQSLKKDGHDPPS